GGHGHRAVAQRHVQGGARERAQAARLQLGEDAHAPDPDPARRPGAGRDHPVRPRAGEDRLPLQV
ncbi:MAG: Translation initiation factor 1, partial [uncultured Acidimicrobiales bacterium]